VGKHAKWRAWLWGKPGYEPRYARRLWAEYERIAARERHELRRQIKG
jgi:hypothetical protein